MDYEYIQNFSFDIFKGTGKFILNNILTIDGYVGKYPTNHKIKSTKYDFNLLEKNKKMLI